jgi:hypothetical protein
MPRLRQLRPLVQVIDTRTTPPLASLRRSKAKAPIYDSPEFRAWRAAVIERAGAKCEATDRYGMRCNRGKPHHRVYADHLRELRDGGDPFDLNNGQCLCASHHVLKTVAERARRIRERPSRY